MIRNYFKIAWRNIKANRVYSIINIVGLTIGLASCLLVSAVILNDLSYDRQWSKTNDIYRIISKTESTGEQMATSPSLLGPQLILNFPEVKSFCPIDVEQFNFTFTNTENDIGIKCLDTEETIWDILDFKVIKGSPQKIVKGYPNLVISQKIKELYFPDTNPVGKVVKQVSSYGEPENCIITGVIENLPPNTHLYADALFIKKHKLNTNGFRRHAKQYLLLKSGGATGLLTDKINTWYKENVDDANMTFSLQPIKDVYLKSEEINYQKVKGNIVNVRILTGVAILLLLIACINFINMSTARISKRMRETGIQKVLGAGRKTLILHYLIESVLFFVISFVLGLLLYMTALPSIENFLGHPLGLNITGSATFLFVILVVVTTVSILTGLYPAWLLSKPKPSAVLTNRFDMTRRTGIFRKGLVVLQFAITIVVIVSTLTMHRQIDYLGRKDLGFNKENLLSLDYTSWGDKGPAFKEAVKNIPGVESVSISSWTPSYYGGSFSFEIENPKSHHNTVKVWYILGDADLPNTLKLKLKSGESFDRFSLKDYSDFLGMDEKPDKDKENSGIYKPILLTNYTAELLGITALYEPHNDLKGVPVGIVENFHNESLRNPLAPTFVAATKNIRHGVLLVRLIPGAPNNILRAIHTKYKEFYPNYTFGFSWVADELAKEFLAEKKLQDILKLFSFLIISLSCMGLFGLITFMVQSRVKEISIRKILGASVTQITVMLSKGSFALVLLAILIAVPIAWYGLQQWLMEFPYRIQLNWLVFAQGGLIALVIALCTLGIRTLRASIQNPADNLRND